MPCFSMKTDWGLTRPPRTQLQCWIPSPQFIGPPLSVIRFQFLNRLQRVRPLDEKADDRRRSFRLPSMTTISRHFNGRSSHSPALYQHRQIQTIGAIDSRLKISRLPAMISAARKTRVIVLFICRLCVCIHSLKHTGE